MDVEHNFNVALAPDPNEPFTRRYRHPIQYQFVDVVAMKNFFSGQSSDNDLCDIWVPKVPP